MLSEAASLRHVSPLYPFTRHPEHQPAIVIVTVDVKDLLALDTENTAEVLASSLSMMAHACYPESTHSVRPVEC
jgi:hypothetical protein